MGKRPLKVTKNRKSLVTHHMTSTRNIK